MAEGKTFDESNRQGGPSAELELAQIKLYIAVGLWQQKLRRIVALTSAAETYTPKKWEVRRRAFVRDM
jgi:hypothetical protein